MGTVQKIVLLIDDDMAMNAIISTILKDENYSVFTADTFRSGLEKARSVRPDMIILDLYLADKDGGDLLNVLRSEPRTAHIPILMLSGETKLSEIKRVMHLGADHYLLKPFTPQALLHRVEKFMRDAHNPDD